jgi:hypothetical protein
MLDAVRSYFYPSPSTPLPIVEPTPPVQPPFDAAEIKRRLDALKDKAEGYLVTLHTPTADEQKTLAEKLKDCATENERKEMTRAVYHCNIKVKINPTYNGGAAAITKWHKNNSKQIYLHPLMLCSFNDFPEDLRPDANGEFTPNEDYFKRLGLWVREKFNLKKNPQADLSQAMHFLLWYNSPNINHVKDFALAHEVGHLHHRHGSSLWNGVLFIALTACIGTILYMTTPLIVAILVTIVAFVVLRIAVRCFPYLVLNKRNDEKEADLTALKLVKTTAGAEDYFTAVQTVRQHFLKPLPWHKKVRQLISKPEVFFRLTHPEPNERIAYIKKFAAQFPFEKSALELP